MLDNELRMSKSDSDVRLAAAQRISELGGQESQIRSALECVLKTPTFRSSRRSRQFLRYVVEKALEGRFEELKERVIGSALIGRSPDYDTSGDAIVRVIASETRRRLQDYYDGPGRDATIWFEVPSGSYIPSIHLRPGDPINTVAVGSPAKSKAWLHLAWFSTMAVISTLCVVLAVQNYGLRSRLKVSGAPPASPLPWQALFNGNRGVQLVLADTSIGGVQVLMKSRLSLSDYLNRKFIPETAGVSPEMNSFLEYLLQNQFTSASYATTAARIAQIAQLHSTPISLSFARGMSLRTFKGGDHLIVIGTTRANPWAQLFEEHLNFVSDYGRDNEPSFRNRGPGPGEPAEYKPREFSGGTSRESYGHIAFLPRLYHDGHALLVSGTSSEGTEGAGEFVADPIRMRETLRRMHLDPDGAPRGFEILLIVNHTTGAPVQSEVRAWRLLTGVGASH